MSEELAAALARILRGADLFTALGRTHMPVRIDEIRAIHDALTKAKVVESATV